MKLLWWSAACSWLGWGIGVLLTDSPSKSPPTLKSWLSWHNLYCFSLSSFAGTVFMTVVAAGKLQHISSGATNFDLRKINIEILFLFYGFCAGYKRFYFWIKAKRMVRFLGRLDALDSFGSPDGILKYVSWKVNVVIGIFFLLRVSIAVLYITAIFQYDEFEGTWFDGLPFPLQLTLLTVSLFVVYLPLFVTVVWVLTVAILLIKVLEDFCDQLEFVQNGVEVFAVVKVKDVSVTAVVVDDDEKERSCSAYNEGSLIRRMEEIKSIFDEFDDLYGPMLFLLIMTGFVGFLNGSNSLIVEKRSSLWFAADVLRMLCEFFVLLFMELGHQAQKRIKERKRKLRYLSRIAKNKSPADNAVALLLEWDWTMTACSFFEVNRSLLAGLVTTTMSYIIIIFQFNTTSSCQTEP